MVGGAGGQFAALGLPALRLLRLQLREQRLRPLPGLLPVVQRLRPGALRLGTRRRQQLARLGVGREQRLLGTGVGRRARRLGRLPGLLAQPPPRVLRALPGPLRGRLSAL
ncbi:hypothetical protein SSCG_01193 [Streptomyces clavuligerus]|nr:hypothetical protein SSCG_01193 [Streptomyces clavuligerus]